MPDATPGNAKDSPIGNGDGATVKAGASAGGGDLLANPTGNGTKTGGRDFTGESRPQQAGGTGYNPDNVPPGGAVLKADPGAASSKVAPVMGTRKPFKV